jgi:hypothetical protein
MDTGGLKTFKKKVEACGKKRANNGLRKPILPLKTGCL